VSLHPKVQELISIVDPVKYAGTRNFLTGSVTNLSPYITHGVISTFETALAVVSRFGYDSTRTLVYELAWRDYFQRVWADKGDGIFNDLLNSQPSGQRRGIPASVYNFQTGIEVIDAAVQSLYLDGYVHNHARMWIASIVCSIGRCKWEDGARWFFYHLLDGDLASNTLNWQWIAGTFSKKPYLANQDNLNHFSGTKQKGTFLDVSYEGLLGMSVPPVSIPSVSIPSVLEDTIEPLIEVFLPKIAEEVQYVYAGQSTLFLYHIWMLDPNWRKEEVGARVLVIEPSFFRRFPISQKRWNFILSLTEAMSGLTIWIGEVSDLPNLENFSVIHTRAHPSVSHYPGLHDPYPYLVSAEVDVVQKSFSAFWKRYEPLVKNILTERV
jgi:deoxyribodipyrimidine photo-lyase